MKYLKNLSILILTIFIFLGINHKVANSQEVITIKSDTARLYFAGLFPSYIFYMQ